MQGEHVRVTLHHQDPTALCSLPAGKVDPEQLTALVVQLVLRGVEVLRPATLRHRARPEAEYSPAGVGKREHDPAAETVVERAAPPALREPGGNQLLRRKA